MDAGALDDTVIQFDPLASGGARNVDTVGWAWPDEVYPQGSQVEDGPLQAWDTGRSAVGQLPEDPTLNTSSSAAASAAYYALAESTAKNAVEQRRAKRKRSAGLYAAWMEDPPGKDVSKVGVQVSH